MRYEIPKLQDVLSALGIQNDRVNDNTLRVTENGVEFYMRYTGMFSRAYSTVTVQLKAGGHRGERRFVTLHRGQSVDERHDEVVRRPLTETETAKLKERYEYLKGIAEAYEQAQVDNRKREEAKRERQRQIAETLPDRFDIENGSVKRKWDFNPVDFDIHDETVSVSLRNLPPEKVAEFIHRVEEVVATSKFEAPKI